MTEPSGASIRALAASDVDEQLVGELAALLRACVEGGASIGFAAIPSDAESTAYWRSVAAGVQAGDRILLVCHADFGLAGTVQVEFASSGNGSHRAEIAKLMVHPRARRRGLARRLLAEAEEAARHAGRTLLVLDTRLGDPSEALYRSEGYLEAGVIPGYARSLSGSLDPTIIMYKPLSPRPQFRG